MITSVSLLQNSSGSEIDCREELLSLGARASRPHKTWQGRGDWLHRVGRFTCRLALEQRLDKYAGGTPALPGGNPWLARCRSLSRALFCRSILPPSHARLRILQKAPMIERQMAPLEGPFELHLLTTSQPLPSEPITPKAEGVIITEETLEAKLADGSIVSVPLAWYPRLVHATPGERDNWELVSQGQGVRWPDLDEDLSVEGLIAGRRSGESQRSFERWLEAKRGGRSVLLYDLIQVARPTEKNSP